MCACCVSICACRVFVQAGAGADGAEELTEEEGREILEMKNSSNIYTDMVNSVAPTVFGHSEVVHMRLHVHTTRIVVACTLLRVRID